MIWLLECILAQIDEASQTLKHAHRDLQGSENEFSASVNKLTLSLNTPRKTLRGLKHEESRRKREIPLPDRQIIKKFHVKSFL